MVFNSNSRETNKEQRCKPHTWFAWHPVRVSDTQIAWLQYVVRKGTLHEYSYVQPWTYEYSLCDSDVLLAMKRKEKGNGSI